MGLPNLINKFKKPTKAEKEFFLALLIMKKEVKSAIWMVEEGRTRIMSLGSREIWENGDEDLTTAVDRSLAVASERFSDEGNEPTRVIFGLAEDWTNDNKILPEYQKTLSRVCERMELKPAGFVSVFDALVHHLRDVEGSPASAIFINPQRDCVWIVVVEVGKVLGIERVSRSEDIAADVYEGLRRFSTDKFPSRMLLFDGEDLESLRQVLISYQWQEAKGKEAGLPFLHFPKVEILPQDFDITSVAIAGGSEVAKSLGFEVDDTSEGNKDTSSLPDNNQERTDENLASEPKVNEVVETGEIGQENMSAIGEDDLGFVEDKDVKEEESFAGEVVVEEPDDKKELDGPTFPVLEASKERKISLPTIRVSFPKLRIPEFRFNKFVIIVPLLLFLTFGGIGVWALWYFPKSNIVVSVTPKFLDKNVDLTIDPNQESIDANSLIVPGKIVEIEEQGEKTIPTTGQKTVGDKAKGEVSIFNRTDSVKTLPQGTIVIGPGNLKFSLDRDVTIASKTPDLVSGVDKWGESTVAVTAFDIGAQYNLAQKSQFTVKDYPISSFLAKNNVALAGGTSRQISAVSDVDQTNLLKSLTAELIDKGNRELGTKAEAGSLIVDESISSNQILASFDRKVGEEGQEVTLKLTIKVRGLSYRESDLNSFAEALLKQSVPSGYMMRKEDTDSSFNLKKKNDDGSIIFEAKITANLLPVVDFDGLKRIVKGKTVSEATDYLRTNVVGFRNAEITIKPRILPQFQVISKDTKNIYIEIIKE